MISKPARPLAWCGFFPRGEKLHHLPAARSSFSLVDILPGAEVVSTTVTRPVLTLAVCPVAGPAEPGLQSRLSQAFRYALSSKIILQGERSTDLLAESLDIPSLESSVHVAQPDILAAISIGHFEG